MREEQATEESSSWIGETLLILAPDLANHHRIKKKQSISGERLIFQNFFSLYSKSRSNILPVHQHPVLIKNNISIQFHQFILSP